jgi:sugar lactone lactonase YvrE
VVVERLAGDMTDLEGPVWHPAGNYLLFSDNDTRRRWDQIDGARSWDVHSL